MSKHIIVPPKNQNSANAIENTKHTKKVQVTPLNNNLIPKSHFK